MNTFKEEWDIRKKKKKYNGLQIIIWICLVLVAHFAPANIGLAAYVNDNGSEGTEYLFAFQV